MKSKKQKKGGSNTTPSASFTDFVILIISLIGLSLILISTGLPRRLLEMYREAGSQYLLLIEPLISDEPEIHINVEGDGYETPPPDDEQEVIQNIIGLRKRTPTK